MPATIFSNILKQAATTGSKYGDLELHDFFRDKALQVTKTNINRLIERKSAKANEVVTPRPGRMLMYKYDPKHKSALPYYDTFPVIFPIEKYKDGWLGINMHYLPPTYRARLMDALYDTLSNQRYDDTSKMQINYKILSAAAKFKYFKPTIHRYLASHVQSPLMEIDVKEWDYVMMLPLARFQKTNQRKVWDESIRQISGARR